MLINIQTLSYMVDFLLGVTTFTGVAETLGDVFCTGRGCGKVHAVHVELC